jgi:hypothetical protein
MTDKSVIGVCASMADAEDAVRALDSGGRTEHRRPHSDFPRRATAAHRRSGADDGGVAAGEPH